MPSLEGADAWLNRADEQLENLKTISRALVKSEVDAMIASLRFDFADGGKGWAYTKPTAQVPQPASILMGECIQALRRCLDYLIYEVAWLDSDVEQQGTQFPIDYTQKVFDRRRSEKIASDDPAPFLRGLNDRHTAAIKRLQPFKKPAGPKWVSTLGNISNPDKHRHLTVAKSEHSNRIVGWSLAVDATQHEVIRVSDDSFTFSMNLDDSMPSRMHMKFHVTAYVALEGGAGVVEALDNLKTEVARVLEDFRPCFEAKCHH